MALLGWVFIHNLFAAYLPADQLDSYIAGLILLAAAPCTAMVFVWSRLSGGDANFTLSQVALNDTIMIFAFAPVVGLLLGSIRDHRSLGHLATLGSALYRSTCCLWGRSGESGYSLPGGESLLQRRLDSLHIPSLTALLATLVLLFGFQGEQILSQPLIIVLLAIPILIQVYFNSGLAYLLNKKLGVAHCVAAPSALIGASNFFELAVATAIVLFGFDSGAALATGGRCFS